jgi:hypothetical protein
VFDQGFVYIQHSVQLNDVTIFTIEYFP